MENSYEKYISYSPKEEKTEEIQINAEKYSLTNKPSGNGPSLEMLSFVIDEWEKPRDEYNTYLNKGLQGKTVDYITDNDKNIIALCSYREGRIAGFGILDLILVREDYRNRKGIGLFLIKRAIDKILETCKKEKDSPSPVEIFVGTDTQAGFNLIQKMQEEYKDRVLFQITDNHENDDSEAPELQSKT